MFEAQTRSLDLERQIDDKGMDTDIVFYPLGGGPPRLFCIANRADATRIVRLLRKDERDAR